MSFLPEGLGRKVAEQGLLVRQHSPGILFGAGLVSMVGSTVLACRATLKLEEVMATAERDMAAAEGVRELHPEEYSEGDHKKDTVVIYARGVGGVIRLYAPAVVLGGIGVVCLTKSHRILQERNTAISAAYLAVDQAFKAYRERVVERYGEQTDRELRYDYQEVEVIDNDTGKVTKELRVDRKSVV